MDNKIDKQQTTFQHSQYHSAQLHRFSLQSVEPTEQIFPTPSFLFEVKDDRRLSENKTSLTPFNHFKPKFDPKVIRGITSKGNRFKTSSNHKQMADKIKKTPVNIFRQKMERAIESEIETLRNEHNNHLRIRKSVQDNLSDDEYDKAETRYQNEQISPYAKYSTNSFPRKSQIPKPKQTTNKNDFLLEVCKPSRKPIFEQLQQLQGRLTKMTIDSMLEVMTIFSIKQQKCERKSEGKPKLMRKKQLTERLSPDKRNTKISIKTRKNYPEEEHDFTLDKIYSKKIYSLMTFILKLQFSNNIPLSKICLAEKYANEKIKVYVGGGNNKFLVVALLKRRFWLEFTNKITADTKFIWTQNTIKDAHSMQRRHRPTEESQRIKTDASMLGYNNSTSLTALNPQTVLYPKEEGTGNIERANSLYTDAAKQPQGDFLQKIQYKLPKVPPLVKQENNKIFLNPQKASKIQAQLKFFKIYPKSKREEYKTEGIELITNHIPNNSFIGSKKALFYTMEHYYRSVKKIDPFTIIPKTYHFKSADDEAFANFLQYEKQSNQKKIWIVKPGECTNRGTGIYLMRTSDISRRLLKKQHHSNGQVKTTIVQSYITDPLLYHGRKFDIRHYLLITTINGNLKAYWYDQGYLRTSSEVFTLQNLQDIYVHLTNDAIQKNSQNYGKYQLGNKASYNEFQRYLDSNFSKKKINFREDILSRMKEITADVVKANYLNMDKERKMNNFEIFGLDFMIDSKFRPWLIEINANPCLEISCPLLSRIIPTMVEHSLRIGLDPLILPPSHYPPKSRYYLSDNFLEKLKYEIIFDELQQDKAEGGMQLDYNFDFDEPEDEYQNQGAEIDLAKIIE